MIKKLLAIVLLAVLLIWLKLTMTKKKAEYDNP